MTIRTLQERIDHKELDIMQAEKKIARMKSDFVKDDEGIEIAEFLLSRDKKILASLTEQMGEAKKDLELLRTEFRLIADYLDYVTELRRGLYMGAIKKAEEIHQQQAVHYCAMAKLHSDSEEYEMHAQAIAEARKLMPVYGREYTHMVDVKAAVRKLEKDLDTKANQDWVSIKKRIMAITGDIQQVDLTMTNDREVEGTVSGKKGRCEIKTKTTGFGFRTSVKVA